MSSTCGLGGAGIASSNNAAYLLNRRAKPPSLVPMFVDTAGDDDKSRVGADEFAIDVGEGAGTRLELHTSNARALLTRIANGNEIHAFKHVSVPEAERLLATLAADGTGSGEQPLVTALALHPVGHQLREAAQRFVAAARAVNPGQPPILIVPSGLGGGAGPGSLPPVLRVLRELAPDATIVVILMTPGPWHRFGADRVAHMNAKAIAALLAVSARQATSNGANVVYLLGAGSGAYPDAEPTEGVCAVAGEFIAQIATHPSIHHLDFANVVQQLTPQAPFATLGAARVDLLAIDRGERLGHEIAVRALGLALELETAEVQRAAQEGDNLIAQLEACHEALDVARTPDHERADLSDPGAHEALLAVGMEAGRRIPRLTDSPLPTGNIGPIGGPRGNEIRHAVLALLGRDRAIVGEHLEENALEGQTSNSLAITALLERELPPPGFVLGSDPPRVTRLRELLLRSGRRYQQAAEGLRSDVAEYVEERDPVGTCQRVLDRLLADLDDRRVSKPRMSEITTAMRQLMKAVRWQIGAAASATLFELLAAQCRDAAAELDRTVLACLREMKGAERRHMAQVEARLATLHTRPNCEVVCEPGGSGQAYLDQIIRSRVGGDDGAERHALREVTLCRVPQNAGRDGHRFVFLWPAPEGAGDAVPMAVGSDGDLPPVPLTLISSILIDDVRWKGTRTAYTEIPLMDALGQDAQALADAARRPLEETIELYAKALTDRLRVAARPLAAVIPRQDDPLATERTMLTIDSRPAQSQEGRVTSAAFDTVLSAMNRTDTDRADRQPDLHVDEATIMLSVRRHGIALEQFTEVVAAVGDYHSCDEPVHTSINGWHAHRLMRTGLSYGLLGADELLDPAIINLLAHGDGLLYAGLAMVGGEVDTITQGSAPFETEELFVITVPNGHIRHRVTLGPYSDPAAALVAAATRASEIREPLLEKATRAWQGLVQECGNVEQALNKADELLDKMPLAPSKGINVKQLRIVLRLLLARGAASVSAADTFSKTPQMLGPSAQRTRAAEPKMNVVE
jgi:hypothetical protein